MVTNAKVTVDDLKKSAATAASTVKATAANASKEVKKTAATAKKTVAKKASDAVKTVAKKVAEVKATNEPKVKLVLQYRDYDIEQSVLLKNAKASLGSKFDGLTKLDLYVKPEEGRVYYVADKELGSFDL